MILTILIILSFIILFFIRLKIDTINHPEWFINSKPIK